MLITKIEKLKNNKYKVIIDNQKIITFDNVILDNNLLYKKNIDVDLYNKILKDTQYYENYNKVVKHIIRRRRSEKEIREYMVKLDLNCEDIEKIILKLKNTNLINDLEYCRAYINDSIYLSKNGINKIKDHLVNQDISINVIDDMLNNIDLEIFDDRLEKLIVKKIKSNNKLSNSFLKQKLLNEMIHLGYSKEKVIYIIEENLKYDKTILIKEFDRLYKKLSSKYNDKELLKNIKQKLLLKGFVIEEINKLMQEKTED